MKNKNLKKHLVEKSNLVNINMNKDFIKDINVKETTIYNKDHNYSTKRPLFLKLALSIFLVLLIALSYYPIKYYLLDDGIDPNNYVDEYEKKYALQATTLASFAHRENSSNLSVIDSDLVIDNIIDYLPIIEELISDEKINIEYHTLKNNEFQYLIKVNLITFTYEIYYSETEKNEKTKKDKNYSNANLIGKIVIGENEYQFEGKRNVEMEAEEIEIETELTLILNDSLKIKVEEEKETENQDVELSYKYSYIKDDQIIKVIELEFDEDNMEIEITKYDNNKEENFSYEFKRTKNNFEVKFEYEKDEEGEVEVEFIITITDIYTFNIRDNIIIKEKKIPINLLTDNGFETSVYYNFLIEI